MEEDPLIPQRMRDIARVEFCVEVMQILNKCGGRHGILYFLKCREEKEAVKDCVKNWLENDTFKRGVTLEYLNERSHYRQTGVKSKRYRMSNFVKRDRERDGPPLDEKGNYRPQKPQVWFFLMIVQGSPPQTLQCNSRSIFSHLINNFLMFKISFFFEFCFLTTSNS